jgi:hypothetical protein
MSTKKSNLLSKKVILVVAILAVSGMSIILIASSIAQATTAQQQQHQKRRMMGRSGEAIPQINGSVSIANETNNLINEKVNVLFVEAAQTAQGQVSNGAVYGGQLGIVWGYLVYTLFVLENTANQIGHLTVIDAGNGQVLYISEGQALSNYDHSSMFRLLGGGHGYGGWNRPWERQ